MDKVAVVTGSNKGIGYSLVKKLLTRGVGVVYLTARDTKRGLEAVKKLNAEGQHPKFHQLDTTDTESIKKFARHVQEKHGGINILANNAGISDKRYIGTKYEEAKNVVNTNYGGLLKVQEHLFPVLKERARVINLSSSCGNLSNVRDPYWIKELSKEDLHVEDVNAFIDWALFLVKNGDYKDSFADFTMIAYRISKVAICALTRVQQRVIGRDISINSIHPGAVKTDMTLGIGNMTADQACESLAFLALDVDQSVKGKFFWFDKSEKDWTNVNDNLYLRISAETLKKIEETLRKTK